MSLPFIAKKNKSVSSFFAYKLIIRGGFVMGFWQVTLGDVIGYVLTVASTAITVSVIVKVKYSSHHNRKANTKVNQSSSIVGRDQIGGDKR